MTVEMIAKSHSSQKKTDLSIVQNASKNINQHQEVVVDLAEDRAMVGMTEVLDLVEETTDHEKCLTQNVVTVEMIAKSHSSQKKTDLSIVENVSKNTDKDSNPF